MSDYPREIENLGNVDGERPDVAVVKVTGKGFADRAMLRGERVALTVIGEVVGISFKQESGALVRTHTVRAETMAEATGQIREMVVEFLREIDDAREGRAALPLDEADDDEDEADDEDV